MFTKRWARNEGLHSFCKYAVFALHSAISKFFSINLFADAPFVNPLNLILEDFLGIFHTSWQIALK
jgi:hypothetical protein